MSYPNILEYIPFLVVFGLIFSVYGFFKITHEKNWNKHDIAAYKKQLLVGNLIYLPTLLLFYVSVKVALFTIGLDIILYQLLFWKSNVAIISGTITALRGKDAKSWKIWQLVIGIAYIVIIFFNFSKL